MSGAIWVVAVPIIVWAGVFAYVAMLDRKLAAIAISDESEH